MKGARLGWIGAVVLLGGCASISQKTAFQSVRQEVANQTGMRVVWNQGTADDAKAEVAVRGILARPLDVNDAVQVALLNNPDLQASFEEIGISQADLVQAGLLHNPTFLGSWRFPNEPPSIADTEYSLAYDFLDLILVPLKRRVATANLEEAELRLDRQVLELATEVKTAFYTFQAELQMEGRFKLIVRADQAAASVAAAQEKAGNTTDLAYANEEAQFASSRLYLVAAQREMIATREKLNRLMGLWGEDIGWTARPRLPELPGQEVNLGHLESRAIAQRHDLAAMRRNVDAIGLALSLKTHLRFVPAAVNIGVDTEETPNGQRVTGPTLEVELPLFDQGQGAIGKLDSQYRMAQRELESRAIEIRSEVREGVQTVKMDRDLVEYYRKVVVPLNIQIVNQSLLQYNAMQRNTFDLFMSKERELDAEKSYIEAWRDYWIARAELEEAVGGALEGRDRKT